MAIQTNYVEKLSGDPWTLVTSDEPVRLAISKWLKEAVQTGWVGKGFSKFAVLVCVIIEVFIILDSLTQENIFSFCLLTVQGHINFRSYTERLL